MSKVKTVRKLSPNEMAVRKLKPSARAKAIVKELLTRNATRDAYEAGYNLSRYLEALDPSAAHGQGNHSDAFNRALAACGIRTSSDLGRDINASTLEDVVEHPQARHLAIEIFARAYRRVIHAGIRTPSIASFEGPAGS